MSLLWLPSSDAPKHHRTFEHCVNCIDPQCRGTLFLVDEGSEPVAIDEETFNQIMTVPFIGRC